MHAVLWLPARIVLSAAGLAVSALPRALEIRLGPPLGRLILACGFRRKIVEENIRHCYPELAPRERARLALRNYEHYGLLLLEYLHFFSPLPGHFRRYAARISRFEGREHWEKAHAKGKGVLVVSSHMGFWEMNAAAAGLAGVAPTVVTTVLKPKWLHDKITACRSSCGVSAAYHPGSVPSVLKALRRGGSVAFMNDQYAGPPMGMPVEFFGVKVATLSAVGPLALRTGAAIVPVSGYRDGNGICRIVAEPELDLGEARGDAEKATTILAAKVEAWVRRRPEQWLWLHRRFKHVAWPDDVRT